MGRLAGILARALVVGAGFGAATALVNAFALRSVDLESRTATTSGWSPAEIVSVLLDAGWAWAGLAVLTGWLVTRAGGDPAVSGSLARGAAAGALALLAATAAYGIVDMIGNGGHVSSHEPEAPVWWITSVVFGAPLGAIGACITSPGLIGLLARITVPVGAAVQMVVLPPGRNEAVATIGQAVVWTAAAASVGFAVVRFLMVKRRRTSTPM